MKKIICAVLCIVTALLPLAVVTSVSADAAAPTGQIWEGETYLRQNFTIENEVAEPYAQNVAAYNEKDYETEKPSCDCQMISKTTVVGESVSFILDVACEGKKTFYVQLMKSNDFGNFDIYWDSEKIASDVELYTPSTGRYFFELNLGDRTVVAGEHTLKFTVVGKDEQSTNYYIGIDYFELVGTDGIRRTQKLGQRGENYGKKTVFADGTVRLEAEALALNASSAEMPASAHENQIYGKNEAILSYCTHFFWKTPFPGDTVKFDFSVEEDGEYEISFNSMSGKNYGTCVFDIDGQQIGEEADLYSLRFNTVKTTGKAMLKAGTHTIGVTCMGCNELSTDYKVSFDYIEYKKAGTYVDPGTSDETTAEDTSTAETSVPDDTTPEVTTEAKPVDTTAKPADTTAKPADVTTAKPADETTAGKENKGCGGFTAAALLIAVLGAGITAVTVGKKF